MEGKIQFIVPFAKDYFPHAKFSQFWCGNLWVEACANVGGKQASPKTPFHETGNVCVAIELNTIPSAKEGGKFICQRHRTR